MGLDAHIMTNFGKKFYQKVMDFIMYNEDATPCGTGEGMLLRRGMNLRLCEVDRRHSSLSINKQSPMGRSVEV